MYGCYTLELLTKNCKVTGPESFSASRAYNCLVTFTKIGWCAQLLSRIWLCSPMDCSLAGSSIHGISQARILEWVSISYETAKETLMYRTVLWTLWERVRVGRFGRMALKHVKYHVWNELPVQVRCTILELGAGALGQPRGMVWGGRREEGSGWGTHVYLWRIHFDIWQN